MKINAINFDEIILNDYKDSYYFNLIGQCLDAYKKIFLQVYDRYNDRFKKIYPQDLFILHYYLKFLEVFRDEAKIIIKSTENTPKPNKNKSFKNKKQIENYLQKILNVIINAKVLLVIDNDDFNNQINQNRQKDKPNLLYIGIIIEDILNLIDNLIFFEARYFIDMAEHKKTLYDPYKSNYSNYMQIFIKYEENLINPNNRPIKNKEFITAIRDTNKDRKFETASGGSSFQQQARKFKREISNLKLSQSDKTYRKNIIKQLRGLE